MFGKLSKPSRYGDRVGLTSHALSNPQRLSATLFAGCPIMLQLKHQSSMATSQAINPDGPPRTGGLKAMKKPIITGRNSKTAGYDIKELVPNPFIGRALPFGRRTIIENELNQDLASGKYWSNYVDRMCLYTDFDLVQRGWGNTDFYRIPSWKQPYDDITVTHDIDFQFRICNLAMHVEMVRHIQHLKPLWPEIYRRYSHLTRNFQDIVSQVMHDKESAFDMRTSLINDWRKGCDFIDRQKQDIAKQQTETPEEKRKRELAKHISFATVKQFVDNKVDEHEWVKLIFIDAGGTKHYVYGMVGETLLQCCRRYSIPIDGYCNSYDRGMVRVYGEGAWCAQCQMDISPRYFHLMPAYDVRERSRFWHFKEITPTSRLGCVLFIRPEFDGMVVNIPVTLFMPYGNIEAGEDPGVSGMNTSPW